MNLLINDSEKTIDAPCTVAQLLLRLNYQSQSVAVAVDGQFIPKSMRERALLTEGATVEIVSPMQGG
ncbi:MAG: sulfur carrier protein ThiS [Cyanobacteria bacterium P01_H01_bin.74]